MLVKVNNIDVIVERTNNDYYGNPRYRISANVENFRKLKEIGNKLGFRKARNKNELIVVSYNIKEDIKNLFDAYKE